MEKVFRYVFTGTVMPERATYNRSIPLKFDFASPLGLSGTAVSQVVYNQAVITIEMQEPVGARLPDLRNVVKSFVEEELDIVCLYTLVRHTFDLKTFYDANTNISNIIYVAYSDFSSTYGNIGIPSDTILLSNKNVYFRIALANLRNAVGVPVDTGFYAYRAYESLLQWVMIERSVRKPKAVTALAVDLGFQPKWGDFLSELGGDARHGKPVVISGNQRDMAVGFIQELLSRFARRYGSNFNGHFDFYPFPNNNGSSDA